MSKDLTIKFIDTETTGLDARVHEIISVGIVTVKGFHVVDEREFKILPQNITIADPVALKINKYSPHEWQGAVTQAEGARLLAPTLTLIEETDKQQKFNALSLAGHNVFFDLLFLYETFKRQNISYNLPKHVFDTYSLAYTILERRSPLKSYSLAGLCEHFEIKNKHAHTALSDARACAEVYLKLINL